MRSNRLTLIALEFCSLFIQTSHALLPPGTTQEILRLSTAEMTNVRGSTILLLALAMLARISTTSVALTSALLSSPAVTFCLGAGSTVVASFMASELMRCKKTGLLSAADAS